MVISVDIFPLFIGVLKTQRSETRWFWLVAKTLCVKSYKELQNVWNVMMMMKYHFRHLLLKQGVKTKTFSNISNNKYFMPVGLECLEILDC